MSLLSPDVKFEIGHVLFVDIVGYSKLLINEQSEQIQKLKQIVRGTEQVRLAEAEGKLLRLPTGDGGALVFRNSSEAPVLCALEISKELKKHPELRVRMGVHSGPVNEVTDLNEQANIAGAGINIAQRVMDCGDAGHILLSRHVAEDLEHYPRWRPYLHELGDCEVKHGVRVGIVNLYGNDFGNAGLPSRVRYVAKIARQKSRRRWLTGSGLAVLAIVAVVMWQLSSRTSERQLSEAHTAEKSIAVLPFENLSSDKENAYFASGIQDEILTRLAKIGALKVISRTSTQQYQSKPQNLSEIAKQLGVANILEGSVQKAGNEVHINVQLIKAATDAHLWAESYDRELKNIFGVEGEVAGAIAQALNAKLTGAEEKALAVKPTSNVAAYDAYLRGRSIETTRYGLPAYQEAASNYAEAVRLDPEFALAWASQAVVRSFLYFNGFDQGANSAAAVKEAADRAFALQPELGEAWIAQGVYRYRVLRDFAGALGALEEAHKRLPNSADVFATMAYIDRRLGRWDAAENHFRQATQLDPRNLTILMSLGDEFLKPLRRYAEAQAVLDRALQIYPGNESALAFKANAYQAEGRLDEAAKELAQIRQDSDNDFVVTARAWQLVYERRFDEAITQLQVATVLPKSGKTVATERKWLLQLLGYCQEWAGRTGDARVSFEGVIRAIKPFPASIVTIDDTGVLALAYAGIGDKDRALSEAQRAIADLQDDVLSKPQAEILLAQIEAHFGDLDSAIAALPHLLEVPAGLNPADLRNDPMWDPLRKDPRFKKLCEEQTK